MNGQPLPHMHRDVGQDLLLILGKHQIVETGGRVDALGKVLQPPPGQMTARPPQPGRRHRTRIARFFDGRANFERVEGELRRERVDVPGAHSLGAAKGGAPDRSLLLRCRAQDLEARGRTLPHRLPVTGDHDDWAVEPIQPFAERVVVCLGPRVAFDDQRHGAETHLARP